MPIIHQNSINYFQVNRIKYTTHTQNSKRKANARHLANIELANF